MISVPRLSGLVFPLAVLISALMIGPARADVTPCPSQFGAFSSASLPPACWRPFAADSPFNRQLPASPTVAADSGSIIANLAANRVNFEGGANQFAFTSDDGRDAVYYSQPTDPVITIHCTYQWGPGTCTGANKVNIDGRRIHIPAGAQPQDRNGDLHMTVVDQANDLEYDFEHATWSADHSTLNVWAGAEIPSGPNLGTGLGGGGTAAGIATLAGLITAPELAATSIDHALAITLPCTNGAVYPAGLADGLPCSQMTGESTTGTIAPLGTLFQLNMTDAQIATSGAPTWEQAIMTAMAHYGMYVNDTSDLNNIELEAESDVSYTSLGGQPLMDNLIAHLGGSYYAPLSRWILTGIPIPITKLRVIDPCYAQGLCTASPSPPPAVAPAPSLSPVTTSTPPSTSTPTLTPVPMASPAPVTATTTTPSSSPVPVAVGTSPSPASSVKKPAGKSTVRGRRRAAIARAARIRTAACRAVMRSAGAHRIASARSRCSTGASREAHRIHRQSAR